MIRSLNITNKADFKLLSSLVRLSTNPDWKEFQSFLEVELHRLDVSNRVAQPYESTRLGAAAETMQDVINKVVMARGIISKKKK